MKNTWIGSWEQKMLICKLKFGKINLFVPNGGFLQRLAKSKHLPASLKQPLQKRLSDPVIHFWLNFFVSGKQILSVNYFGESSIIYIWRGLNTSLPRCSVSFYLQCPSAFISNLAIGEKGGGKSCIIVQPWFQKARPLNLFQIISFLLLSTYPN